MSAWPIKPCCTDPLKNMEQLAGENHRRLAGPDAHPVGHLCVERELLSIRVHINQVECPWACTPSSRCVMHLLELRCHLMRSEFHSSSSNPTADLLQLMSFRLGADADLPQVRVLTRPDGSLMTAANGRHGKPFRSPLWFGWSLAALKPP